MRLLYKLKRYCHFFINNFFYFLVFVLGFFLGFIGKNILPQVLALEDVDYNEKVGSDYKYFRPSTTDYKNLSLYLSESDILSKLDLIRESIQANIDSDKYGLTIALILSYKDNNELNKGNLFIATYLLDEYSPYSSYLSSSKTSTLYIRGLRDSYDRINFLSSSYKVGNYMISESISFSNTGWFITTPLDEFKDTFFSSSHYAHLLEEPQRHTTTGGTSPSLNGGNYDVFLYYSDVDIEFHSNPTYYAFNDHFMNEGEIWPDYYHWKSENPDSFLDGLTYECSSLPILVQAKPREGEVSSSIYFDYNIPTKLYPYFFHFYQSLPNSSSGYDVEGSIIVDEDFDYGPFESDLWHIEHETSIYEVPFTVNSTPDNYSYFVGVSNVLNASVNDYGDRKVIDWTTLDNIENFSVPMNDYRTYLFLKYAHENDIGGIFTSDISTSAVGAIKSWKWLKSYSNYLDVNKNNLVFWNSGKFLQEYMNYLVTSLNTHLDGDMCYYYDPTRVNISMMTFSDDGSTLEGMCLDDSGVRECVMSTDMEVFSYREGFFGISHQLKSAVDYVGKLFRIMWDKIPSFVRSTFITIFGITIVFVILRMVGFYG